MLQRAHGWTSERFFLFVCLFFPFCSHKSSRSCSIPPPPPSFTCWRSMGTMATGNCEPVRGGGKCASGGCGWLPLGSSSRQRLAQRCGAGCREPSSLSPGRRTLPVHTPVFPRVCERENICSSRLKCFQVTQRAAL